MSDNELLIALSNMMDKKLQPIYDKISKIEIQLENDVSPRLQNVESCYTSTYHRYASGTEKIDAIEQDVQLLKKVVIEHSQRFDNITGD